METLNPGDVGYIPQGYGHSIENVGSEQSRLLIAFNTGDYQAIDLSNWIAGNPEYLLAANLGLSDIEARGLPREQLFIGPR